MCLTCNGAPTFVDGVGDLVKGTAIALLSSIVGNEGGHCREESTEDEAVVCLGWLRARCGCVEISGEWMAF